MSRSPHPGLPGGWPPDIDLVERARSGDTEILGAILRVAFPKLVAFYRGMGLPAPEAEDVASEAIEGMVRNIRTLREPGAFEGWLWTIARNRVRTNLRRRGRIVYELDSPQGSDPSELAIEAEEHRQIRVALAQLSPKDREILWLREVEQLTHEEIAGRIGMGAGAVRVAALRARRRLEEIYARTHPVSE